MAVVGLVDWRERGAVIGIVALSLFLVLGTAASIIVRAEPHRARIARVAARALLMACVAWGVEAAIFVHKPMLEVVAQAAGFGLIMAGYEAWTTLRKPPSTDHYVSM